MKNNSIKICGQSFDKNSKYFSFDWPFRTIEDMEELKKLSNFPKLSIVSLGSTNINDIGLKYLAESCPKLENLDLQDTEITDSGLKFLARLKHLKILRLKENHQLTDKAIRAINLLKHLEDLQLHETGITPQGWQSLNLPNLTFLMLPDGYDKAALLDLSKRLRNCEILIKGCCIQVCNGGIEWEK